MWTLVNAAKMALSLRGFFFFVLDGKNPDGGGEDLLVNVKVLISHLKIRGYLLYAISCISYIHHSPGSCFHYEVSDRDTLYYSLLPLPLPVPLPSIHYYWHDND